MGRHRRGENREDIEKHRLTVFDTPLRGEKPDFFNAEFRQKILELAFTGMSEKGVAMAAGISWSLLRSWVSMGEAEPDIEPHGSFARSWHKAIRAKEVLGARVLHEYQKRVCDLAEDPTTTADELAPHISQIVGILRSQLPQDWGDSKHREIPGEITGDEYLQGKALLVGQIRGALKNPERPMREALLAEGDTILGRLLEDGWEPSEELAKKLKTILR